MSLSSLEVNLPSLISINEVLLYTIFIYLLRSSWIYFSRDLKFHLSKFYSLFPSKMHLSALNFLNEIIDTE